MFKFTPLLRFLKNTATKEFLLTFLLQSNLMNSLQKIGALHLMSISMNQLVFLSSARLTCCVNKQKRKDTLFKRLLILLIHFPLLLISKMLQRTDFTILSLGGFLIKKEPE